MSSVIIGATNLEQLKQNIDACCMELDEATEAAIDEVYLQHGDANMQD
jgi:aryl-alcohol dehydrogenase-like predicted oxidoreductase